MNLGDIFQVNNLYYEFVHEGCVDPTYNRCTRQFPITVYLCYPDGTRRYATTVCIEKPVKYYLIEES